MIVGLPLKSLGNSFTETSFFVGVLGASCKTRLYHFTPALILIGLMYAVAIFLPIIIKRETNGVPVYFKFAKKISWAFGINATVLLFLVFFRFENIQILSMRVMFLVDLLVFLIWIIYIFIWARKNVKKEADAYAEAKRRQKYLPKTKK